MRKAARSADLAWGDRKIVWWQASLGETDDMGAYKFSEEKQSKISYDDGVSCLGGWVDRAYNRRFGYRSTRSINPHETAWFAKLLRQRFRAIRFHPLHPFFPTGVFRRYARDAHDTNDLRKGALAAHDHHKKIMKPFVLFLFSIKLIVLARRAVRVVVERRYARAGVASSQHRGAFTVPPSRSALNERIPRALNLL